MSHRSIPLCNAGNCIALATHGSVCAVHAKHPAATQARKATAEFLKIGIDYDWRPERYAPSEEDEPAGWVLIASVVLNSMLSTSIMVEARCIAPGGIDLRISDDEEGGYVWSPRKVVKPFTLRELIRMMDSVRGPAGRGLVWGPLRFNRRQGGMSAEGLENFVTVESKFYLDLERHYRGEVLAWVEGQPRTYR